MTNKFTHFQSAHCENGVTTNMLRHVGVEWMTEPLAFGMGAGLFYIWIPLLKVNNGPAIAFRSLPGSIFKTTCKSLGIPVHHKKFSSPQRAEAFLDQKISEGRLVGCQVGVYYLPYFPKEYRFHFNAHNLLVYGMEGDEYLVSDPIMEEVTTLTRRDMQRVRFAKGAMAPRGHIYYPGEVRPITTDQIRLAIRKGIQKNVRNMIRIPGNFAGVAGIKYTAGKIRTWRDQLGLHKAGLYLAQIVRMQEEIGTGGGGFRYIYGAFLEQASAYLPEKGLMPASAAFTRAGDRWRDAAVLCSGIYKGKYTAQSDFEQVAALLTEISAIEKEAFTNLSRVQWG
jgi:hypothetical protein